MRKYIIPIAICMLAACTGEKASDKTEITITVTLPEIEYSGTRTGMALNANGGLTPSWQEGDKLLVGGNEFKLVSVDGQAAQFRGYAPAGKTFDIVLAGNSGDAPLVQKADNDVSHLSYSASLIGVNSCEDVHFTHGWAAAHGGSLTPLGWLKLVLNLPAKAKDVSAVSFRNGEDPEISLSVENGAMTAHSFTAWIPSGDVAFEKAKNVTVVVTDSDGQVFTNAYAPDTFNAPGGFITSLILNSAYWASELSGKGSEADPYVISNVEEFNNIRYSLTLGAYTWFKMTEDIDFTGVTDWEPINLKDEAYGIMFDGQNHTVSNFHCGAVTWASIFGVLHGEVKDLNLSNCEISTTTTSPCGLVTAWVGDASGKLQGRLENVHATGCKVSTTAAAVVGGLSARAGSSTIENCSFGGTVERKATTAYKDDYTPAGGLLGQAYDGVTIKDCSVSGSITASSGRGIGAIMGQCTFNNTTISGCSSTMTVSARDDVVGGIAGYFGGGTISDCTANANISVSKTSDSNHMGGIVGHTAGTTTFTGCRYNGTITGVTGIIGGILGQCGGSGGVTTIDRCYTTGKIVGSQFLGGIVGRAHALGLNISDCGSTMDIVSSYRIIGGLVGDAPNNTVVKRCFASGAVSGTYAIGGLFGRAFGRQSSTGDLNTDVNTTIEDCIAFNPSVKTITEAKVNPTSTYSGGAVVGCSSRPNTLKNCWRNPSMEFDYYNAAYNSLNTLFDHEDSSPENWLKQPDGSPAWFSPYHGKAAAPGQTLSQVAQSIGWSGEIWDFSGEIPVLK